MKQNELDINGMDSNKEVHERPKPLKKLVRANNTAFSQYPPANEPYRGQHEAPSGEYHGQHEAPSGEYHGQHEVPSGEYHGQHEAPSGEYHGQHEAPAGEYRGKHEAPAGEYHGKHEAPAEPYRGRYEADNSDDDYDEDYEEYDAEKKRISAKDVIIKTVSVLTSIAVICMLVLNMPIFVDKNTGGNVSLVYLFKHAQPMAKEGQLKKENVELNLNTEVVTPEFNDGLDLPQLVEGQYSILFLGFDEEELNSDVMWVVQFDIGNGAMNILQIPRDCCLPDYTSSVTKKFNSIYSCGDPNKIPIQRVVDAVQENFGIPIDAYITTACFDIVRMVDIIGGIPIHLDNEIIYEADKIIPAGDVVLDGQQAEWFVRFRHEWLQGDIGRMQNQRRFMAAAMMKLFNIVEDEGRIKLYSYIKQIKDEELIYTDLSIDDMSKVADFASTLSMDNVHVNMVPGEDAWFYADDGEKYSVYSVHKQETIDMLNEYFRPYQVDMNEDSTTIVELVLDHSYAVYDDTGTSFEELETATEPLRDPEKKPWWKED
ncbi:MAG: LCP family protein [Ruminococcus sp.]|nr:LCP family protein [Ruminococcus sp.]